MAPATQLTFAHELASRTPARPAGPGARLVARAKAQDAIDAACCPGDSVARERELDRIRAELRRYIAFQGVGARFQAADFITHLHAIGRPPDTTLVDPRCTGRMFMDLCAGEHAVLARDGFKKNLGNKHTGYHSTCRPVYEIRSVPPHQEAQR
jgi:hypothetical protein